ncbi:MAG: phasin family protein [Candidatus Competibacteraceae bacterium]
MPSNPLTALTGGLFEQIRLAGVGAFAKAQREGARLFTALIEEGQAIEARFKGKPAISKKPRTAPEDVAKLEQILEDSGSPYSAADEYAHST